jgi:hypothetical protein
MRKKEFRKELSFFLDKIRNNIPFAFLRFSDGEQYILDNLELKLDNDVIQVGDYKSQGVYKQADHKHFDPNEHAHIRELLLESAKHKQPEYYKGIGCVCCNGREYVDTQMKMFDGDSDDLTWANLWVNGNYPTFISWVLPEFYSKDVVMICHKDATLDRLPFVVKDFRVGYNAMVNDLNVIDDIDNWITENKIEGHVFLFSASSFTNIAIHKLFQKHPNNTFIDIGTCLTPMMDMPTHRGYLQSFWNYQNTQDIQKICIWN